MTTTNAVPHYELLHALLRKEKDEADTARCRKVLIWASDNLNAIGNVLDVEEARLFGVLWKQWTKYQDIVSSKELAELAHKEDKSEGMISILKAYDEFAPSFNAYDAIDAQSVLGRCIDYFQKYLFTNVMRMARQIVESGIVSEKKGEPNLIGIEDARLYLINHLESGLFRRVVGGSMKTKAPDLIRIYDDSKRRSVDKSSVVKTAITQLDGDADHIERGSSNPILDAAGQRKSGMARSIAYNAAISGKRVLFVLMEAKYEEELAIFRDDARGQLNLLWRHQRDDHPALRKIGLHRRGARLPGNGHNPRSPVQHRREPRHPPTR